MSLAVCPKIAILLINYSQICLKINCTDMTMLSIYYDNLMNIYSSWSIFYYLPPWCYKV